MKKPTFSDWGTLTKAAFVWFFVISAAGLIIVLVQGPLWIAYLAFPSSIVMLILIWGEYRRAGVQFWFARDGDSFSNNPLVRLLVALVGAALMGLFLYLTR